MGDTWLVQKEGQVMEQYNQLAQQLLEEMESMGKNKSMVCTTRTSLRKLRDYMESEKMKYSPEVAAKWLELTIRPNHPHSVYKQIRFVHFTIATRFDATRNLRPLFYQDTSFTFELLPFWAQKLVSGFLDNHCQNHSQYVAIRSGISVFLIHQIKKGMAHIFDLNYESCIEYSLSYGTILGVRAFLAYLENKELIAPYASFGYNFAFSKRVIRVPKDSALRNSSPSFSLDKFKRAQQKAYGLLVEQRYSKELKQAFLTATNEFGLFLGINELHYTKQAADFYIAQFQKATSINTVIIRRSILSIEYLLKHGLKGHVPLVFSKKELTPFPMWSEKQVSYYIDIRKKSGLSQSTLDMDRSSLLRFLSFLDKNGCKNYADISATIIKEFNRQDCHSSSESKNAYNIRIRGFLKFLEAHAIVPSEISKAIPTIFAVRNRPMTILSNEDWTTLQSCGTDTTVSALETAVLKLMTQTGLRSIDICGLRSDSIDWRRQELSLIQEKTKQHIRLPFSNGVGNAIVHYIKKERPQIDCPYLFISPRAPHNKLSKTQISTMISKTLGHKEGPQIIRRTFASRLLQSGVGYDNISDILGHLNTTSVDPYLVTDIVGMRQCSIPLGEAFGYKGGKL